MALSEQTFQSQVIQYLQGQQNAFVFKVIAANLAGIPDIIACINGRFVAVEVKKETGMSTRLQLWVQDKITNAGGLALTVRPSTFARFKKMLTIYQQNWRS